MNRDACVTIHRSDDVVYIGKQIYTVDDVTDGQFQSLRNNNPGVMADNRTDVVVGSCVERLQLHFESWKLGFLVCGWAEEPEGWVAEPEAKWKRRSQGDVVVD